jgi:hypothetical protein
MRGVFPHYVFLDVGVCRDVCVTLSKRTLPHIALLYVDVDTQQTCKCQLEFGGEQAFQENLAVSYRQMEFHLGRIWAFVAQ